MNPLVAGTIESLDAFSIEYQAAPFEWLYESDIQGTLLERLRTSLASHRATIVTDLFDARNYGGSPQVEVNVVKTEYPGGTRFDIGLIDPDRIRPRGTDDKADPFWNQPVRVAIELKLCWVGYRPNSYVGKVKRDVQKIDRWRVEQGGELDGFAVVFLQAPESITPRLEEGLNEICGEAKGPTRCWAVAPDRVFRASNV